MEMEYPGLKPTPLWNASLTGGATCHNASPRKKASIIVTMPGDFIVAFCQRLTLF